MRQGVVLPETPRDRRNLQGLEEDVRDSPLTGKALPLRLRNFRPDATQLPRLARRAAPVHAAAARDRRADGGARAGARRGVRGVGERPSAWRALAERWDFGEVNDLIDRHNRWYPVEARLPMDPRTGDYALVNGERYSKAPLDAAWILQRFPVAASVSAQSAPPRR